MPRTRHTVRGEITYSAAKEKETNVLHTLDYPEHMSSFFTCLGAKRNLIKSVAAHHLGLSSIEQCHISERADWLYGSFNLCIPITVDNWKKNPGTRVIIRFPLPYKVGEAFRPGNADEKIRCEAGTYAWIQQNCPTVPIPRLYGFGLSTGQRFTALEYLPLITRCVQKLHRWVMKLLGYPASSRYIPHHSHRFTNSLGTGYLLIEYIEEAQGMMLGNTWNEKRGIPELRTNLFRGLSQIMLALAKVPLPRIGAFIIDDDGFLSLENRPLSLEIQELENMQIPVDIPRDFTYFTVDSYVADVLSFHDSRLRHQPNAVNDKADCIFQMSALTMMKTISPLFLRRDLRRGPFIFSLTDLHQSNILVDENWNIKYLIDLEWAFSRPVEMLQPPRWLTNEDVDTIVVEEYDKIRQEFMSVFKEEEGSLPAGSRKMMPISPIMEQGWEMGTFWYTLALRSPTGLFRIFYDHIQTRLAEGHEDDPEFFRIVMWYWTMGMTAFMNAKLKDKEDYDKRLREAFED